MNRGLMWHNEMKWHDVTLTWHDMTWHECGGWTDSRERNSCLSLIIFPSGLDGHAFSRFQRKSNRFRSCEIRKGSLGVHFQEAPWSSRIFFKWFRRVLSGFWKGLVLYSKPGVLKDRVQDTVLSHVLLRFKDRVPHSTVWWDVLVIRSFTERRKAGLMPIHIWRPQQQLQLSHWSSQVSSLKEPGCKTLEVRAWEFWNVLGMKSNLLLVHDCISFVSASIHKAHISRVLKS